VSKQEKRLKLNLDDLPCAMPNTITRGTRIYTGPGSGPAWRAKADGQAQARKGKAR